MRTEISHCHPLKAWVVVMLLVGSAVAAGKNFVYQNPISDGIDPRGVRDCQVFRDGSKWYMTGTAFPVWPKEDTFGQLNPGVVLYSSDDLLKWKFEKVLVRPNPTKWYFQRFWAPEVRRINGKYYATFNCRNNLLGDDRLRIGYAVADSLMGPYRPIEKPLTDGNDLTFFQDDDGAVWAFWNRTMEPGADRERARAFGISCARIDLEKGEFLTEPTRAIGMGEPAKDWDSVGIEGSSVFKRDGTYYLFYSSWSRGYEIGVATSKSITGPWVKSPRNPIYSAQDVEACQKSGVPFTGDPASDFSHVGHNSTFIGPDGKLWLSCHGILRKDPQHVPKLMIEPIEFDDAGNVLPRVPRSASVTVALP